MRYISSGFVSQRQHYPRPLSQQSHHQVVLPPPHVPANQHDSFFLSNYPPQSQSVLPEFGSHLNPLNPVASSHFVREPVPVKQEPVEQEMEPEEIDFGPESFVDHKRVNAGLKHNSEMNEQIFKNIPADLWREDIDDIKPHNKKVRQVNQAFKKKQY